MEDKVIEDMSLEELKELRTLIKQNAKRTYMTPEQAIEGIKKTKKENQR